VPVFGGVLPPEGLPVADAIEFAHNFYRDIVVDLTNEDASKHSTNLQQRLLDFEMNGMPLYGIALKGPSRTLRLLQNDVHADSASFTDRSKPISARHIEYEAPNRPRVEDPVDDTEPTYDVARVKDKPWSPAYGTASTWTDDEGWRCIYNELTWLGTSVLEFADNEGYEHDFVLNNYDGLHWAAGLRGTSGYGWESNLPTAYLDYATVDDNPEEPVYTVGTFTGNQLYSNRDYYTFIRAYPGNTSTDLAKLLAQKMTVYAWSVWLVFSNDHDFLTNGFTIPIESTYYSW